MIRASMYDVKPSLIQKSSHVALVTRLPDHECASSCATRLTSERSPARMVGVANVSIGFSIPPKGKEGGSTRMSYRPHRYGPYSLPAASTIASTSENSVAAFSTTDGSAYTPVFAPIARKAMSPTASAKRYGGTGCLSEKRYTESPAESVSLAVLTFSALMTARIPAGAWIVASYVCRMPGLSCVGIQVRVRIAWPCVNRKGSFLPAVCAG